MTQRILRLGAGAVVACALVATPAQAASTVNVRVEGAKRELLDKNVSVNGAKLRRSGGTCPGNSALAALNRATKGRWAGTYSSQYQDFLVSTIMGEKPANPYFWAFWVNGKLASKGACGVRVRKGDDVLFLVDNFTLKSPTPPLALHVPARATAGKAFTVVVVADKPNGSRVRVANALVTGAGVRVHTNGNGVARIVVSKAGRLRLRAEKAGYVRTALEPVNVIAGQTSHP